MSKVSLYCGNTFEEHVSCLGFSSGIAFVLASVFPHSISMMYSRAVTPEQWLQRHPEAGSSWPSWSQASHRPQQTLLSFC